MNIGGNWLSEGSPPIGSTQVMWPPWNQSLQSRGSGALIGQILRDNGIPSSHFTDAYRGRVTGLRSHSIVRPSQIQAVRHDYPLACRFLPGWGVTDSFKYSQPPVLGLAHSRHLINSREIDLQCPLKGTKGDSMEVEDKVCLPRETLEHCPAGCYQIFHEKRNCPMRT